MKLTLLLLVCFNIGVHASGYGQKVNLKVRNTSIEEVFEAINKQTNHRFLYASKVVRKNAVPVTVEIKNENIDQALRVIFKNQNLEYEIIAGTVNVKEKKAIAAVVDAVAIVEIQQKQITGTVKDASGEPLVGVSVAVKGTNRGTTTNNAGAFTIPADKGEILVFSSVGFSGQEVQIANQTTLNMILDRGQAAIDEVVVVGYGTVKKENLTGSVATVKSSNFENRPSATPSNLLQGVAAGLAVSTSGQGSYPGGTSSIKVRNFATWKGGTDPLYVIDGFTRDKATFDNLNPNDIESISILKDAASAAIYGMKAGNGVLLVTTKSGSATKTDISYNANYTYNKPTRLPQVMNAYEQATLANIIFSGQGLTPDNPTYFAADELEHFKTNSYSPFQESWDNPWGTNHNLSIRGGAEKIRYFVSGSYLHQGGGLRQTYDKYTVLSKLDGEITKGLTFGFNVNASRSDNSRPNFPYGTDQNMGYFWYYLYYALPYMPGEINGLPRAGSGTSYVNKEIMKTNYRKDQRNALSGNFELNYEIPGVEGLAAKFKAGYSNDYTDNKSFSAAYKEYYFKTAGSHNHYLTTEFDTNRSGGYIQYNDIVSGQYGANEYLSSSYAKYFSYQLDLMLTYNKTFGKHSVSALVGYEPSESNNNSLSAGRKQYANRNYQEINGGSSDNANWSNGGTSNYYGQASYFSRVDYNYDQRYLLGFTFRRDGDLRFAPENRWGNFPAVSAGWNIANEDFFIPAKSFAEVLKLRASYGLTGSNGNIGYWLWQQSYNYNTSSGMLLGSSLPASITLGTYVNPNVTWEKNYNTNIGLDYSFPNRLVNLTVDWWKKKTVDILDSKIASTPSTVGATLPAVNYGKAVASGIEITLSHENQIGELRYQVGTNWTYSTNKFLEKDQASTTRDYYNQIGKPIDGWITGYVSNGIIKNQGEADRIIAEKGTDFTIFGYKPAPGMIMYEDLRGPLGVDTPDGKIDGNDATLLSTNGSPRISYGFNFNLNWRGFGVNTIFAGFTKYDVMLAGGFNGPRAASIYQTNLTSWNDSWTPDNTDAAYPNAYYSSKGLMPESTFWMRSGSFLRLKNVTLSYSIPQKILGKSLLKGLNAYVSGENLLLWDKIRQYDPELGSHLAYPIMKSFSVGLNVSL